MKNRNYKNTDTFEVIKLKVTSRDNKHYFYGILLLVLVTIIFRPQYAQSVLTIIMGAGGGLGFAQLIKK